MMRHLCLAGVLLLAATPAARAAEANGGLKAAIVYNLARFTTWRDERFSGPADPVTLCVEPSEPFAEALKSLDGKPVGRRRVSVRVDAWPFGAGCELAYVPAGHASAANLDQLAARGVLTVGDTPDFARSGAIRLIEVGRQIRFEINNKVASNAGAQLSSQVLSLAVRVR
jgi:hypothetical protein